MKHEQFAERFIDAIVKLADNPVNLDNFECYLSHHFPEWLEKFANTPEGITAEIEQFANMSI